VGQADAVLDLAPRIYGPGLYEVTVDADEAVLMRAGEVLYCAHALDGDHLDALERLLAARVERLS
jgi:hypothetical protein